MSTQQKHIVSILGLILAILLGVFVMNIPVSRDLSTEDTFMVDTIDAYYIYENNTHDYSGIISLPNPCYSLTTEAIVRESYPEQVTLAFTTQAPDEGIICAQVIKEEPFRIIFTASPEARIDASFNGKPVTLVVADTLSDGGVQNLENITIEEIN